MSFFGSFKFTNKGSVHQKFSSIRFLKDIIILLVIAVIVLAITYWLLNENFAYIFLTALVGSVLATVFMTTSGLKNTCLFVTTLLFSLLVGESVLRAITAENSDGTGEGRPHYTKGYSKPLRMNGGPLGYGPIPDNAVRAWKTVGSEMVYDVVYSITPAGIRFTPGGQIDPKHIQTFVFFGGSRTFGEGLNDDQTLPYFFGRELGFENNVVNLGFSGYGPHQMLRALELGIFDHQLRKPIGAAIYSAISGHVERTAGNRWWDPVGPKYVLDPANLVRYSGPFMTVPRDWEQLFYRGIQVIEIARRSLLIDHVAIAVLGARDDNLDQKIRTYIGIVKRISQILRTKFDAELYILFWDKHTQVSELVLKELRATGIRTVLVSDYIPVNDRESFAIPNDGHPNAAANELLAGGLANLIVSK